MILKALRNLLLQNVSIRDLTDGQMYPYALPQGVKGSAVDMRSFSRGLNSQALQGAPQIRSSQVVLDCYAEDDPGIADEIALQILEYAPGYRGSILLCNIHEITSDGSITQTAEPFEPGGEVLRFVSSIDLDIVWSR